MKKAQGAMEYLMTYSWAILVVMVVGIAMWQLGIFNLGGGMTPTSTGFGAIKPQLAGTGMDAVSGTDQFEGIFTNGAGTSIGVTAVTISTDTGDCATEKVDGVVPSLGSPVRIGAGNNFLITGDTCGGGEAGSPYVATISIEYNLSIGSISVIRSSSGSIRGPYD